MRNNMQQMVDRAFTRITSASCDVTFVLALLFAALPLLLSSESLLLLLASLELLELDELLVDDFSDADGRFVDPIVGVDPGKGFASLGSPVCTN